MCLVSLHMARTPPEVYQESVVRSVGHVFIIEASLFDGFFERLSLTRGVV